mmetsp:Transcript_17744/g.45445  ORF Transcript_17744/g.45445 Transcript_17744/m.45445 type:complete len:1390 (-) Transcript_17744:249-4418(-)
MGPARWPAAPCPAGFVHAGDAMLCAPLAESAPPSGSGHLLLPGQRGVLTGPTAAAAAAAAASIQQQQSSGRAADTGIPGYDSLCLETGQVLRLLEADAHPAGLLDALRRLIIKERIHVAFCVEDVLPARAHLRLEVFFPTRVWMYGWQPSTAAALLFRSLTSPEAGRSCLCASEHGASQPQQGSPEERFSLSGIFQELNMKHAVESAEPIQPLAPSMRAGFAGLPAEAVRHVAAKLTNMRDMCALGATCRGLHSLTQDTVPGVLLDLYPHQRAAVRWMRAREQQPVELEHPSLKHFTTSNGMPWYGCQATGKAQADPPPPVHDIRGGLFCDEPGLGKTITALSLILSSPGRLPEPPEGVKVQSAQDPLSGRLQSWYIIPDSEYACASPAASHKQGRRVSERRRSRQSLGLGGSCPADELASPSRSPQLAPPAGGQPLSASGLATPKPKTPVVSLTCNEHPQSPARTGVPGPSPGPISMPTPTTPSAASPSSSSPASRSKIRFYEARFAKKLLVPTSGPGPSPPPTLGSPQPPTAPPTAGASTSAASLASCLVPPPSQCLPGWIPSTRRGSSRLSDAAFAAIQQANEAFFCDLLEGHQELLRAQDPQESALWWLAGISPSGSRALLNGTEGLKVPTKYRATPYQGIFERLGLVRRNPSVSPASHRPPSRRSSGEGASPGHCKRKRASGDWQAHVWTLGPAAVGQLDTEALKAALKKVCVEKVYLSTATLVVVPSTLVQHWRQQVDAHIQAGRLRICELSEHADAESLAWHHDLVLTTFDKLSKEWQNTTSVQRLHGRGVRGPTTLLMRIHWQRIILDEGHTLGQSLGLTSKLAMATALKAGSRWVMTGTPAPSKAAAVNVAHLQPLLSFLHQVPYGVDKAAWDKAIQQPVHALEESGRARLLTVLQRIMIRASKADLRSIPPCWRRATTLKFAPEHARSYNQLVEVIRRNLLLADWNDDSHRESLLHPRQSKWLREMVGNVRLSCCVAGNCNLTASEEDLQETMELLAARLELPSPKAWAEGEQPPWLPEDHPLAGLEERCRHGGDCDICGAPMRMPIVVPCGHALCVDCLQRTPDRCPIERCAQPYKMQAVDDPARLENNSNPKWPVPCEVIEWQPAYAQRGAVGISGGKWSANWQVTQSTKCVHMLRRLQEMGVIGPDGGPPPPSATDAFRGGAPPARRKAIVFSQFWMHIRLASRHLAGHGVPFCVLKTGTSQEQRNAAVNRFQKDPQVGVLLMDDTGSVGLDLSFVSYVLLLEPIADLSLEEQVISRAHRMGASAPILVETLLMRGTAEEEMFWMQRQHEAPAGGDQPAGDSARRCGSAAEGPDAIVSSSVALRPPGARRAAGGPPGAGQLSEAGGKSLQELGRLLLRRLHNVALQELPAFQDAAV